MPKQLLGIRPHFRRVALGQLQEARQEVLAELLARLAREERGEVVDGNDGAALAYAVRVDVDGGGGEGGVDRVDGDGVVRVGGAVNVSEVLLSCVRVLVHDDLSALGHWERLLRSANERVGGSRQGKKR